MESCCCCCFPSGAGAAGGLRKSLDFLHGGSHYKQDVCPRLLTGDPAAGAQPLSASSLAMGLHTQLPLVGRSCF